MATPIASFSQPAQILALDEPYAGNAQKLKEKKDEVATATASQYNSITYL